MLTRAEKLRTRVAWLMQNGHDTWASICDNLGISPIVLSYFIKGKKSQKKTLDRLDSYITPRYKRFFTESQD